MNGDTDDRRRDRVEAALHRLTSDLDPEDPVVAAVEPVVAHLKGWRTDLDAGTLLDSVEGAPKTLYLHVVHGDAETGEPDDGPSSDDASSTTAAARRSGESYLRHARGWRVVHRVEGHPDEVETVDREAARALVESGTVHVDTVSSIPADVRGRLVQAAVTGDRRRGRHPGRPDDPSRGRDREQ